MKNLINKIFVLLLFIAITTRTQGQTFNEGIPYQFQITGQNGTFIANSLVSVQINIRSNSLNGNLDWQEEHLITTNSFGHIELLIGQGISTGLGSSNNFTEILWQNGIYFLEILVDEQNSGSYSSVSNSQIFSVPYALHSKTTDQKFKITELLDVDTTGIQIGDILKWNGLEWVTEEDNTVSTSLGCDDTVAYSNVSGQAIYADTSFYTFNAQYIEPVSNAINSTYSDTANYSLQSYQSSYSDSSSYADTANYSFNSINSWSHFGNDNTNSSNFIGTTDSTDFIMKTNNIEFMRIKANGKIGIGTVTPITDFHIDNNNGVLFTGLYGTGTIPIEGAGTRLMWYPKKASMRTGTVTSTQWDDIKIGNYSFSSGYNTISSGDYSTSFGYQTTASGDYSFSAGHQCLSQGDFSFSVGEISQAKGPHSIAMGRNCITGVGDSSAVAIGYHCTAGEDFAMAFGNYSAAYKKNSFAFGARAISNHEGSFIYSDASTNTNTYTTAQNQFLVKASGGVTFYTDASLATGVFLAAGGGAWSSLSDKRSKENITKIDIDSYLNKLDSIEIYKWNYITQSDSIKHIGPMAQDFYKYFEIGNDSTRINSIDFDGVNLAILKALYQRTKEYEDQSIKIDELNLRLVEMEILRKELESILNDIMKENNAINTTSFNQKK